MYRLLICIFLGGCAPVVHDFGAAAGSGAIAGVGTELRRGDNQRAVMQMAGSPEIQTAGRSFGAGLGQGMVDEMLLDLSGQTIPEPRVADSQATGAATIAHPMIPSTQATYLCFRDQIEAILAGSVRLAVRQGLDEATNSKSQSDANAMAEMIGDGATKGALTQLRRDGMPMLQDLCNSQVNPAIDNLFVNHIRPILRDFFRDDIGPAIINILRESAADALKVAVRPDNAPAVVQNARNISSGATMGSHDAMIQLGLLTPDGAITPSNRLLFWGVLGLVGLIGLVTVALLVVLVMIAMSLRRGRIALSITSVSKVGQ